MATKGSTKSQSQQLLRDSPMPQAPPQDLWFPTLKRSLRVGQPTQAMPMVTGEVACYKVKPSLPDGLQLDMATGLISGVPLRPNEDDVFTVTAHNRLGSTSMPLRLEVCTASGSRQSVSSVTSLRLRMSNQASIHSANDALRMLAHLHYPGLAAQYHIGEQVRIVPEHDGQAEEFDVEPDLPTGLTLHIATGRIEGVPEEVTASEIYLVTARGHMNITESKLHLVVKEAPDPKDLVMKVCANDPSVSVLRWSYQPVPRDLGPGDKTYMSLLMGALADNMHLAKLSLANVELQVEEVQSLAKSLEKNTSLTHLDISSNNLRRELLVEVGEALKRNAKTAIKELIVDQACIEGHTAQQEETFATLAQQTPSLIKLGMTFENSAWSEMASTSLARNIEVASGIQLALPAGPDKALNEVQVTLLEATAASSQDDYFSKENSGDQAFRMATSKLIGRIPDAEGLQSVVSEAGVQGLDFVNADAIVSKGLRSLLTAAVGTSVQVDGSSETGEESLTGQFRRWTPEGQGGMLLELQGKDSNTYVIRMQKAPMLMLTQGWQDWLQD